MTTLLKTQKRDIGGYSYSVTQLPAGEGRRVLLRLMKVLSPFADAFASGGLDQAKLFALIKDSLVNLDDDTMDFACSTFGKSTLVSLGNKQTITLDATQFDLHFPGRYLEMLQWLAFCVEVNFSSFFSGLLAKKNDDLSPVASP